MTYLNTRPFVDYLASLHNEADRDLNRLADEGQHDLALHAADQLGAIEHIEAGLRALAAEQAPIATAGALIAGAVEIDAGEVSDWLDAQARLTLIPARAQVYTAVRNDLHRFTGRGHTIRQHRGPMALLRRLVRR